jgi:hypothetical protein
VDWKWPGAGAAAYVPSSLLRYLTFRVFADLQQIPALNELTLAGMRWVLLATPHPDLTTKAVGELLAAAAVIRIQVWKGGATVGALLTTVDRSHSARVRWLPYLRRTPPRSRRMLLNGDASQWDRALQMPHYNARAMPAISFHTGVHLVQWARSGRFTLYDYGSAALNK